jgi:hypothetical protein
MDRLRRRLCHQTSSGADLQDDLFSATDSVVVIPLTTTVADAQMCSWQTKRGDDLDSRMVVFGPLGNRLRQPNKRRYAPTKSSPRPPRSSTEFADSNATWLTTTACGTEHRDRLCRFGSEYVQGALAAQGREWVVVDAAEVDDDLVRDMTEILTSMCARLYGGPRTTAPSGHWRPPRTWRRPDGEAQTPPFVGAARVGTKVNTKRLAVSTPLCLATMRCTSHTLGPS